jgi:hypothetical protein
MRTSALALLLGAATLLIAPPASAVRPTSGGMFSFSADDVVEAWDEETGSIRVHYSVQGPNETRLDDDDGDGIPDFPQNIARTTAEVLDFYEIEIGLRRPLGEEEMGLAQLGGSYALDVYLVDFDHMGDGAFGIDTCDSDPSRCSGFLSIENDFVGYGYPSLQLAIDILTSHELFHGVQGAYFGDYPVWFSEGTGVWGELRFDPDSLDFMWFADSYLEDTGRSLDRPPTGPVPAFAYGTCLWWDFMTTRLGVDAMPELFEATTGPLADPVDILEVMEQVIVGRGDTLEAMWLDFATWNLATGDRAGQIESYDYADQLDGIIDEDDGSHIEDDNRFYPLAATYYRLEHGGGPIWFGAEEAAPGLVFRLLPVADGEDDGPVLDPVDTWTVDEAVSWKVGDGADFEEGGYWLLGTYPSRGDSSIKLRFCLGDQDDAEDCAPAVAEGDDDDDDDDGADCSCAQGAPNGGDWSVGLLLLAFVALRRTSSRRQRAPTSSTS